MESKSVHILKHQLMAVFRLCILMNNIIIRFCYKFMGIVYIQKIITGIDNINRSAQPDKLMTKTLTR